MFSVTATLLNNFHESPVVDYNSTEDTNNDNDSTRTEETAVVSLTTAGNSSEKEAEETQTTHILLEKDKARYSPQCIFEQDSWWGAGQATITNEILNLVKNIVGSGGLSLPAGIAAFGNAPSAIVPSLVVIFVMAIVNACSFSLLGRVCSVTKSITYQQAWDRTIGRRYGTKYNAWIGLVVTFKSILGCWSFSIVVAATCQPLLQHLTGFVVSKSEALTTVTLLVLLPLCMTFRLSSLAGFSMIGSLGTLVTACTMLLRYVDQSYQSPNGTYYQDLSPEYQPSFYFDTKKNDEDDRRRGAFSFFTSPQSLILVSILSQGYVAHYNAPKYYYELLDHTTGRFNVVVNISFLLACITYMIISSLGFLTFGEHSSGFILDNYSYRDGWASISRFGVALSVIFAYPLLFHGGRDGFLALVGLPIEDGLVARIVSMLLLTLITVLAITVNDLTFVLSLSGSTLSTAIIYIFPPLMFQALVLNCTCMRTYSTNTEVKQSQAMMYLGAVLGICGAMVTIVRTFF